MSTAEKEGASLRQRLTAFGSLLRNLGGDLLRQPTLRRRALILVAAVLVCVYALGVHFYVLLTPEIGVRCAFSCVVNHFYPEYLCPEGQEPLRFGDEIVRVGDHPVAGWPQLLRRLNDLGHDFDTAPDVPAVSAAQVREPRYVDRPYLVVDGQRVVRIVYRRGDAERVVWCRLGQPLPETLAPSLLWLLLKVGLFTAGALVFWKRPDDRSAAQFFVLCVLSLGAYVGGYHWWRLVTQPVLLVLFMTCAVLLPPASLHFYLLFPRTKAVFERQRRLLLALLYGPPTVFLVLLLTGYLRVRVLSHAGRGGVDPQALSVLLGEMLYEIYVYFAVSAAYYLAGLVCLVHSFRHAANAPERNQVKWILFGSLAAVVPIGYTLYLAFLQQGRFGGGAGTWPMFAASACVTVAFTVSITRYRLMQLDQFVSSGAVYFLISFVAGLVYYGLVFVGMLLVGSHGDWPSPGQALVVSSAALVLLVALNLARARLKTALDHHFRREKYQLDHSLLRMRQAIDQLVDPPTLARRLLHTAAELLGVTSGAVYLREGSPPLYRLADTLGPPPPLAELASGCPLIEALAGGGGLHAPRPANGDPAVRQLLLLGGGVAHALTHEGNLLAVLVLGPRAGGYTADDQGLLTAFARLTALALVSAEGRRTIEALNRDLQTKVEKIAEQQRSILALRSQLIRHAAPPSAEDGHPHAAEAAPATKPPSGEIAAADGMVGGSAAVRQVLAVTRKVAASQSAVLLRGESGTGKGVLARLLHEHSPRAAQPFVKVHCASLSPGLLESELFGHVKGAFTNAIRDKVGRFEAAHGGTLFLDEIGDISLDVQTKLLRVLQEMTFERVGSSEPVRVDVRLIAATHQDLEALIRQGRFREDLFYRLNVFPITLPPLRERAEDVPELALHFLRLYARRAGKPLAGIDDDALCCLKAYPWPGNVRQLENVIERAVVIAEGPLLTVGELPPELVEAVEPRPAAANGNGKDHSQAPLALVAAAAGAEEAERDRREREHLVRVLAAAGGNKAEAARALGMARSTLVSRLKRLGLN